ncbi:MAG: hypothetical protein Q4D02_01735 [Clostridia bacterium]|nr:hypothetical protein [Clostridia bacterium]
MSKPKILELEEEIESLKKNTAKNIITMKKAKGSINITEAWGNTLLQGTEYCKIGDKLTIDNGKIKIGAGISKVLVSAHSNGINTSSITGDKGISLKKGDSSIAENYIGGGLNAYHQGVTVAPILVDVVEGDEISVALFCSATGTLQFLDCFLTVEAVEYI